MKGFVQRTVDCLYGTALDFLAGLKAGRYWRDGAARVEGGVRVFYGFDRVPGRDETASGGIIKLQDLERMFPNTTEGANILYLVSSALPRGAVAMACAAKRHGVRLVVNQNGVAYPAWHGPGWRQANAPMARLVHMADHVFYQSRFCRESADRFLGGREGPSEVLYNPVDTKVFAPAARRPEAPTLLVAGTHQHWYRVSVAVETLARLSNRYPDARLIVAGKYIWGKSESAAVAEAEEAARRLGVRDRVEFRGAYTQDESVALLRSGHLLLHTKYNDPCPRLVVEAMACGLPIVYSASGGVHELVGDEAGAGVPAPVDWERDWPPDAGLLAESAIRVLENWDAFSAAARRRACERFDVSTWLGRHKEVFERLAGMK